LRWPAWGWHAAAAAVASERIAIARAACATKLLDVLYLFAHLFDDHPHLHRDGGQFHRRRFAAQGVGLALEFLNQEFQPLARFDAGLQQPFDLVQVEDRKFKRTFSD